MDKLLGRGFYIPASAGHALSDDAQRLVVPDETAANTSADIAGLVSQPLIVRTFEPVLGDIDKTLIVLQDDEDQTIVRMNYDEDETILRS